MDRPRSAGSPAVAPRTSGHAAASRRQPVTLLVISSYVFDWLVIAALSVVGEVLGKRDPNKRPFQLENPDISYVLLPFPFWSSSQSPSWSSFRHRIWTRSQGYPHVPSVALVPGY